MASRCVFRPCFAFFLLFAAAAGDKPKPTSIPDRIRDGILKLHEGMASKDKNDHLKALAAVEPTADDITYLFGKENAKLLWPHIEKRQAMMRQHIDELQKAMVQLGAVKKVKVEDVRADENESRMYAAVFKLIPTDVPVYTAHITYEKGSACSDTYLIVNGKLRVIHGLEAVPRAIKRLQERAKKDQSDK